MVLPYIDMNPPRVYMCSPSWTPLPPPSSSHPSGSFQCTSSEHPVSCIKPGLVIRFTYDNIHVSMLFSQIIPPSPSPTESKRLFIHLCLFCCLAYRIIVTTFLNSIYMLSVQWLSHVRLFVTPWITACQASLLSITNSRSPPKLMCIELVMPSSHLILCYPLLLLPPIPPSIRVFSNESTLCMRWPKYWSFSLSLSPSNEHPGLISFRMDWLDLLVIQETLKSLLQHHSSKASILWSSALFIVQLSHPYMITGKNHSLD